MKAAKQTIVSTLLSYIGVVVGAFYTIFIIPKVFDKTTENYGALISLLNYVGIFVVFASFSSSYSIIKFYPISEGKERSLMLSFLLWINLVGITIGTVIFYFYAQYHPIEVHINNNLYNITYFFYPLLFSFTLFSFFQAYCTTRLNVAIPTFLNNTFTKLWMFGILLLLLFKIINFQLFTYLYFGQFIVSFLLLMLYVWKTKTDTFSLSLQLPKQYKNILYYSLFSFFTGSAATLITKVDIQMIEHHIGISEVGFYNIGIFFMTVLLIPKNMLTLVARNIISRDFQKQKRSVFIPKYQKISFAFLLGTLIVFIGICINIDELMFILGDKFGSTALKQVIIILGIGRILESILTLNSSIIEYSPYYRLGIVFETIALLFVIILNLLFIPIWGLSGVALASALIFVASATAKSIFVYHKFRLSPFRKKDWSKVFFLASLGTLYWLPVPTITAELFPNMQPIFLHIFTIGIRSILYGTLLIWIIERMKIRQEYWQFNGLHD